MVGAGDDELCGVDQVEPATQFPLGQVPAATGHLQPELAVGAQHDEQFPAVRVPGEELRGADRETPLAGQVGVAHQPAQLTPAGARGGQSDRPGQPRVADLAAASRGRAPGRGIVARMVRVVDAEGHGQVDPDHRRDACPEAGLREPDGAIESVPIGEGEGVHVVLGGAGHQRMRAGGAVLQGVTGGHP